MIASFLAGLGLFLVGMKSLGANLQLLAGRRMRRLLATATRGPLISAATGLVLGALTQSSNAATFIGTSMVQAGVLPLRRAMPIVGFANVGTAGLVLLATVNIHLAVLWLVGLVGVLSALNLDRTGPLKPALAALLGLGLLFLGIDLMKTGAALIRDMDLVRDALALASGGVLGLAMAFVIGVLMAVVAHSSSTVTILALAMHGAGVLDFSQATSVTIGASLGSGIAVLAMSARLNGAARRLPIHQALAKAAGAGLFLLLLLLEQALGLKLLLAASAVVEDAQTRLAALFLLLQLASALILAPFGAGMERLLARLSPETRVEALSQPHFIYDQAVADPATALDLVAREQTRLLDRLPVLADPLRAEPEEQGPPRHELLAGSAALERHIGAFLKDVLARGCGPDQLDRAVALEAALDGLRAMRETLGEFGDVAEAADAGAVMPLIHRLAEALHLLLGELAGLAADKDRETMAQLIAMTADRGEMMDGLRRRLPRDEPGLPYATQAALFQATTLFERLVWLARRQALLLVPGPSTAGSQAI